MSYLLGNKGCHIVNGNIYTCSKCGRNFKKRQNLQRHDCLFCGKCGKIFSKNAYYLKHACLKPNTTTTCNNCQRSYTTEKRLQLHKCPFCTNCNKLFHTYQKFTAHKCITISTGKSCSDEKLQLTTAAKIPVCPTPKQSQPSHSSQNPVKQLTCTQPTQKPVYPPPKQNQSAHSNQNPVKQLACTQPTKNPLQLQSTHKPVNQQSHVPSKKNTTIPSTSVLKFTPVDLSWQVEMCSLLGLPLITGHSFPTSSRNIGIPTQVQYIKDDGNCFFRCLAFLITGDEKFHFEVRSAILDHMRSQSAHLLTFLSNMDVEQYITHKKMYQVGAWATEIEIMCAAHLLKTDIYIRYLV